MTKTLTSLLKIAPAIAAIALTLSSCKKGGNDTQQNDPAHVAVGSTYVKNGITYNLLWSDEFDGSTVNLNKWTFDPGAGQNGEREYYQSSNAAVTSGNLVISAKKETVSGMPYTSSRLNTSGKFSVAYGRIEARIKIPAGLGLWPAFWMLGQNFPTVGWPQCGEIDIMEHVNADNKFYGTIHWDNNGHAQFGGQTTATTADYHVYAVEWDSSSIKWYVDDTLYNTANIKDNINNTGAFQKPFFVILNLAVGGDFPGYTIDETKLPANMYVDYVRVYQVPAK